MRAPLASPRSRREGGPTTHGGRPHALVHSLRLVALVRGQWAGLLALFLVIAGGTAYAADTIGSADVIDNSLLSADLKNNQAVKSADVANENLTGADIKDQSGVDNCTHGTVRFGELCVGVADVHQTWLAAAVLCEDLGLRIPSYGEARVLAANYDVPAVADNEFFWTDGFVSTSSVFVVNDSGGAIISGDTESSIETVCVTTPTN